VNPEEAWTPEVVAELFDAASPTMKTILLALASQPNVEISAQALARMIGSPTSRIAGVMGAYSSFVYRRWRLNRLPFSIRRDYRGQQTYYSMAPETAAIIGMRRTKDPGG
jgi:hypothetical protein